MKERIPGSFRKVDIFYEGVYRGTLNPWQRFKRFLTHKKDGTKR